MKISASVLATPITGLGSLLPGISVEDIDYIHLDVMDGNFVPQISFGEAICAEVKKLTEIPLDVHLMVRSPEQEVPKYYSLKPDFITFHAETTSFGVRLAEDIRKNGSKVGIALNPGTPLSLIENYLPYLDLILLMTVDPGFYGQSFVKSGLRKIEQAKKMIEGTSILLEVDGGVGPGNIRELHNLGVNISVAGSAVFKSGNPAENSRNLKHICKA
ncbi:MAG: ribulose-phosphate 3-epimerase [Leptospiraceae bacterium]|nr:ribulose-phosphate 3-epimerase [Leptospiraceae bacterium]MCP5511786.1 ribulose-phosphate 3-epimerase [Leptospiraceae bacterium]